MRYRVGVEVKGYIELLVEASDSAEAARISKDAVLNAGFPRGVEVVEVLALEITDHPVVTFARDDPHSGWVDGGNDHGRG